MSTLTTTELSQGFFVKTYGASKEGLCANSHLLCGPSECLLVDGQFLPSEAFAVGTLIAESKLSLKQIFITHGHPDHYFGLQTILAAHPQAKVVAVPEVIADIEQTFAAKRAFWEPYYPGVLPTVPVLPQALTQPSLWLDGRALHVHNFGPAEGPHDCVLEFAEGSALFAGDLVYNREHGWLGEVTLEPWLKALALCETQMGETKLFPGHGLPAGRELFASTTEYLHSFRAHYANGGTVAEIAARIVAQYPDFGIPEFVTMSVTKWKATGVVA